jgi:hypothetical protein
MCGQKFVPNKAIMRDGIVAAKQNRGEEGAKIPKSGRWWRGPGAGFEISDVKTADQAHTLKSP